MSGKSAAKGETLPGVPLSDPLAETEERLKVVRKRLADDMKGKEREFERFKEETLWRLNALSDRTIDIARMKDKNVEECLAQDRGEMDSEFAAWKTHLQERLSDEGFIDVWAKDAFDRLLPFREGTADNRNGGDST
jgi:hypothetical protein